VGKHALSRRTGLYSSHTRPMNKIYVGLKTTIDLPPQKRGYLLIDDDVDQWDAPQPVIFDPLKHSFNPLKGITYKKAREIAEVLYAILPQGENTLTVRNGKRGLLKALLKAKRLDQVGGDEEVSGMVGDLLASSVLKSVLCTPDNEFPFKPRSIILARIDRAELGEFDALVLGVLLMSHFKGTLVVPDLGFYGRNIHTNLIREGRLVAGVNFLDELPDKLRQRCLMIEDKVLQGASVEDAEIAARYKGLVKGTVGFTDFVKEATE
jgi:hypothetical protein